MQVNVSVRPSHTKQAPRNISLYKKADWDQMKQSMKDFHSELLTDLATTDVQELSISLLADLSKALKNVITQTCLYNFDL